MLAAIDYTNVLDTLIVTIPAIIAAVLANSVRRQIKTPSGPTIGEQVERSHLTAIANNLMLSRDHGPTKPIDPDAVRDEHPAPPQVPQE